MLQKSITFKFVCTSALILCAALAIVLLLFPGVIYWLFDISETLSANLLAKRAAALFTGYAALMLLSRNAKSVETIRIVSITMVILFVSLIIVGGFEFFTNNAGPGIWVAIVGETVFAALFTLIWTNERSNLA